MSTPVVSFVGGGKMMLAKRDTLSTAEQAIFVGFRGDHDLIIDEDEVVKTERSLELPNKTKMSISPESYQIGIPQLQSIIEHYLRDSGADASILLPSGKRFNIVGDTCLGVELEFSLDEKIRKAKLNCSNSLPFMKAHDIIIAAQVGANFTPTYWTTNAANYFNRALYSSPNLDIVKWWGADNSESVWIQSNQIVSRKFAIKSSGDKNIYGQSRGNWLEVSGEFVINDASLSTLRTLREKIYDHGFYFDERVGLDSSSYRLDRFRFEVGAISFQNKLIQGDKTATLTLSFKGNIPNTPDNVHFDTFSGSLGKMISFLP